MLVTRQRDRLRFLLHRYHNITRAGAENERANWIVDWNLMRAGERKDGEICLQSFP